MITVRITVRPEGAMPSKLWCCRTGLNCRPLPYQGSALRPTMTVFTTRPEILGTFGVVTSTHWIASAVGMAMLERGGNAFDAAVAAGLVLQVVEPHLNGPGGEMPAILWSAARTQDGGDLRAGPRAGGGDHRALPCAGAGRGSRRRAACHGRSRRLGRLDADAARLRAAAAARRCWSPRSTTPRPAIPACRGSPTRSPGSASSSATHWPTSYETWLARRTGARGRGNCSATRCWRRPGAGCCPRPRAAAGARRRSRRRATPSTAASWPRRSATGSRAPRCPTARGGGSAGC
jgi:hypothetical protein